VARGYWKSKMTAQLDISPSAKSRRTNTVDESLFKTDLSHSCSAVQAATAIITGLSAGSG